MNLKIYLIKKHGIKYWIYNLIIIITNNYSFLLKNIYYNIKLFLINKFIINYNHKIYYFLNIHIYIILIGKVIIYLINDWFMEKIEILIFYILLLV